MNKARFEGSGSVDTTDGWSHGQVPDRVPATVGVTVLLPLGLWGT